MTRRTTYLAGLLGKERSEATNSSHVDDKNEDDEDHDDVNWRNRTQVMMMTSAFLYCPNQERHLRQVLKIMVHTGIIPQSPSHIVMIYFGVNRENITRLNMYVTVSLVTNHYNCK